MQTPVLFRNRLIPYESVQLKDDIVLYRSEDALITVWKALRPRPHLAYGYSCYDLKNGCKISRFYSHDHLFLYWYCDIIETNYESQTDTYIFTDLLLDVTIDPEGTVRVLDLDELGEAFTKRLITPLQMTKALQQCNALLEQIYSGSFENHTALFTQFSEEDRRIRFTNA